MALFKCEKCGGTKEGRCKPKKCPACEASGTMVKEAADPKSGCGCKSKKK